MFMNFGRWRGDALMSPPGPPSAGASSTNGARPTAEASSPESSRSTCTGGSSPPPPSDSARATAARDISPERARFTAKTSSPPENVLRKAQMKHDSRQFNAKTASNYTFEFRDRWYDIHLGIQKGYPSPGQGDAPPPPEGFQKVA